MRFVACLLILCGSLSAQTTIDLNVPSGGTKTLTKAMGVIRPLRVASTVYGKLILEAGVVIEMPKDAKIDFLNGGAVLDCRGTEADPVTIKAQGAEPWGQIRFINSATNRSQFIATYTRLENCHGRSPRATAVDLTRTVAALDHVTVSMPRINPVLGPTIGIYTGPNTLSSTGLLLDTTGIISNCTITGASTGVLQLGDDLEIIDMETINVKDPYIFQPSTTTEKPYHRFSVSR